MIVKIILNVYTFYNKVEAYKSLCEHYTDKILMKQSISLQKRVFGRQWGLDRI